MSTSASESATSSVPSQSEPTPAQVSRRLSRRGWTVLVSFLVVVIFGLLGGLVPVPYVALGPGPTYDTLADVNGVPVVQVNGVSTYPTTGQLRMTTVSLNQDVTLFGALGLWISGRYALAPREEYIKPGETEEQRVKENTQLFQDSQSNAEVAALRHLGYPIKVVVRSTTIGTPAEKVLRPSDRLLVVNGKKINQQDDAATALEGTTPGQSVPVVFQRDGQEQTVTVILGRASDYGVDDRPQGFFGISSAERADVPFETTVHLQDIGGPSAGLIFALAIVDRLTPGDLLAGRAIAGTGEIDVRGNVGQIGGITFKLVAAAEAGAKTFLVPAANCAEARASAPDGLQLVKVDTLATALQALGDLTQGRTVPVC